MPPDDKKSPSKELAPEKAKDTRSDAPGSAEKKEVAKLDVETVIAKLMQGEILMEYALGSVPGLIPALQKRFGNEAVQMLMDADKKASKGGEEKKDGAVSKDGKAGGDGGGAAGGKDDKGAVGKGAGAAAAGLIGGGLTGKFIDKVKEVSEKKGGDEKEGAEGKDHKGPATKSEGKDDKGASGKGGPVRDVKGPSKESADPVAAKEEKETSTVKKGQDPGKKVDEAVKKATEKKPDEVDHKAEDKTPKGKDDKIAGPDPKKAADVDKKSDDLKKVTDAKDKTKNDGNKESGGSKATADQVLDKAKDVASKKDDGKAAGAKLADAGKDKATDSKDGAKDGKDAAKDTKAKDTKAEPAKDSKITDAKKGPVDGKDAKDAKKGSDGGKGGEPDKAGPTKEKKGADAKDEKGPDGAGEKGGKDPGKEDPNKEKADADKNPAAKDAQKAKDDATKGDGGGGEVKDDGGPAPGSEGKDEKGAGAEGKEGAGPDVAGGAGAEGKEAGPAPMGPGAGGGASAIKEKSLGEFLKAHPDKGAEDRVQNLKFANDKVGRDANELKANVTPPPDKSWLDAVTPRQELFQLKKAVLGPNKWTGQDKVLDFMTRLNGALDSIGGAAGKIGLAATIGGAILTLLIPPVGAFLLAVGRVANAVSLACSALRIVTSIITTIMLAVKAAKEKDPAKRLEMMQEMKANVQAGVMAGIDVIMSKIGGKAKGAAGASGGKAFSAAKAAWKEGLKAGGLKGVVKGAAGFVKEGVKTFVGGMKQSFKEGIAGMKGQIAMAKELGVMGTVKALGKGAYSSAAGALKETFVKPFTDMRAAFGSCMNFRQNWRDFRQMITANGGGFSGYRQTIQQINFPNFAGANWKEKAKSVFKDMTNTSAGGYASQVKAGIEGTEAKNTYKTNAAGQKELDIAASKNAGQVQADKQKEKLAALEKALTGTDLEKRKALNGGKTTDGALGEELHHQGVEQNDVKKRLSAYKNTIGTGDRGDAYNVESHNPGIGPRERNKTETNLDFRLKAEIEKTKASFNVIRPQNPVGMGLDVLKIGVSAAKGDATGGDVAKTVMGHTGSVGATASKFMVNNKSQQDKAKKEKSIFEEAAEKNTDRTKAAVGSVPQMMVNGTYGTSAGKVNAAVAPAMKAVNDRSTELTKAMTETGPKTAATPVVSTPTGPAGGGASEATKPPPPPAAASGPARGR
ncbi:MAG: hypothetical protein U1F43_04840 [Myxococcota bacterium]